MRNSMYYQEESPVKALIGGILAGQQIGRNLTQSGMESEQAQREKMKMAIAMHDSLKGQAYNNLDYYNTQYRPALLKMGVPEGLLPQYQTVDELNQGLYRNEQIKALYRQKMEGPKVVGERQSVYVPGKGFEYPDVSPATNALLNQKQAETQARFDILSQKYGQDKALQMIKHENALAQIKAKGQVERPGSYEMVETETGPAWSPKGKGETIPIPGAIGKAKAGSEFERHKFASSQAANDLKAAGIMPDDPEYMKLWDAKYKRYMGGKVESEQPAAGGQTIKIGWQGPAYYRGPDGNKIAIRSEEEYKKVFGK